VFRSCGSATSTRPGPIDANKSGALRHRLTHPARHQIVQAERRELVTEPSANREIVGSMRSRSSPSCLGLDRSTAELEHRQRARPPKPVQAVRIVPSVRARTAGRWFGGIRLDGRTAGPNMTPNYGPFQPNDPTPRHRAVPA
jgi:hypothetical protein